ncbi:MAG: ATP-binding protein, partial [Patescibacteria group bacterium]
MNLNEKQLAWAAFAFVWEVPVIGGGLFALWAWRLLAPVYKFMDRGARLSRPERVYRLTYWYPVIVGVMLFVLSIVGYAVGAAQLRLYADFSIVEQAKNLVNGAVISLFLSVFFYLVFDTFLIRVRDRMIREYTLSKRFWRTMNSRVIGITTVLMLGNIGMVGLITFDALQLMVSRSGGGFALTMLRDQELIATFLGAVLLVMALTISIIVFVGQALTRALRLLAYAVKETSSTPLVVPSLATGDEIEALSRTLVNRLQELSLERMRMAEAKAHTDAILNSMGEGLVVTDEAGRVERLNSQAEGLMGRGEEEIMGKRLNDVLQVAYPDGRSVGEDSALEGALRTGKSVRKSDYTYARKDGTRFPVLVIATPLLVARDVVGAVLLFRDVTQEKAVEQAKTEFVSLASHQLRTPLTAINWYIELLLRNEQLSEAQRADLRKVRLRGQRMVQLVNDLLNVSRLDTGRLKVDPQPTDLVDLVSSVVEEVMPLALQRGCQLVFHKTEDTLPGVPVDRNLLRQVLHNLIVNAVTYSPAGQGGRVWVQLEQTSEGNYLVSVQDYGVGIPSSQRSRVFDKFFRADNAIRQETEGTGLGLYIAKKVITASGGKIWFESLEGRGTTFFVEIPASGMRERAGVD